MIDVYTKNTNGYVLYKAQALCILSMLANQLPMYFKSYRDISSGIDETDIKLIAHKSISLLEEDYPKLSMRLNAAISKSNWCNERLYLSYINHPEIMANEFVRKKINI